MFNLLKKLHKIVSRDIVSAPQVLELCRLGMEVTGPICLCSCTNSNFKPVSHVIFDLDGLLIDSERHFRTIYSEVAKSYGKVYTDLVKAKHMGTKAEIGAQIIIDELEIDATVEEFVCKVDELKVKVLPKCQLMPGAEKVVKHLVKNKVPIAIASSSSQEEFNMKMKCHGKFVKNFKLILLAGGNPDVKESKPKPDIYLLCAKRFEGSPAPEKCLVFEDAPNGVTAAIAAGMQCVMVPDEWTPPELCRHASLVIKSLKAVNFSLFGLPAMT